jgi:hypothetical protein
MYLSVRLPAVLTANVVMAVVVLVWLGVHLFLFANYRVVQDSVVWLAAVHPTLGNFHPLLPLAVVEEAICLILAVIFTVLTVHHFETKAAETPASRR